MSSNQCMILHTYFLSYKQQNWNAYIEHLRTEQEEIVSPQLNLGPRKLAVITHTQDEKPSFSSIGQAAVYDYHISFSDVQRLHLLSKKFGRTLMALESIIDIAAGYESLCQGLFPAGTQPQPTLKMLSIQTQAHKRKVISCMHGLQGTAELVHSLWYILSSS
jgi:hypothetical protein